MPTTRILKRFAPFTLIFAIIVLNLALFTLTLTQAQDDAPPASPDGITHVVVISLDGLRPDAIPQAEMPNLTALAERGAFSWTAQTIDPPGTLPAHASLLTGLTPDLHGVDWNGTTAGCPPIAPPTFLQMGVDAGWRTGMVAGKQKFCHFHQSDAIDFTFAQEGDRSVVDRAIELLKDDVRLLFVHLPNTDYFGHKDGWMSASYLYELGNTDAQLGRLLAALDELALTETTLIVLTSDHGGIDFNHGIIVPETMTIPVVIAGVGVVPNTDLSAAPVTILDASATVFWALGLPLPEDASGVPLYAAFE